MAGAIIIKILFSTRVMPFFIKTINVQFRYRYLASIFLLLLLPFSFDVPFAVVCMPSCALLSNVSFGIHGCSNVPCGIDCMHSMDVVLFWLYRMPHNREGWVLFFLLVRLPF